MPDEIKINRTSQSSQAHPPVRQEATAMTSDDIMQRKNSKGPWIILAVIVVVVIVLGVLFRSRLFAAKNDMAMAGASGYQAVFLSNGQVYFGKLTGANSDYPELTDIYYLQVGPQQGSGTAAQQAAAQQNISLVKLGNELHGPVDEMHINRSQILFYEDMKTTSQVVKAIEAYKANPTGSAAPAVQQQQTAPATAPAQ